MRAWINHDRKSLDARAWPVALEVLASTPYSMSKRSDNGNREVNNDDAGSGMAIATSDMEPLEPSSSI